MAPKVLPRGKNRLLYVYIMCFLTFLYFHIARFCFAQPRQESLRAVRERSGQAIQASANRMGNFTLSVPEKKLVSVISSASRERNWIGAKSAFAKYTGDAPPVYAAVLHAAFRCRKYKEGALIYEKCQQRCKDLDPPVYTQALRIFGKLGEQAKVRDVWNEALEKCDLSIVLASSRIAAAADSGDVETAAEVLDLMEKKSIPIDVQHMSSAIRACWGWGHKSHKAATYFYELCPRLGLKPNLIVFTCLIGAYDSAPLDLITSTYQTMRKLEIAADSAFAETYLISVFSKPQDLYLQNWKSAMRWLSDKPVDRLQAAQAALVDFENDGVELTSLATTVKEALKRLNF